MNVQIGIIYDDKTAASQTVSNAGQAWFDVEHDNVYREPIYANLNQEAPEKVLKFIPQAKITALPTILFLEVEGNKKTIITRLTGNQSLAKITAVYLDALNGKFVGNGTSSEADGEETILPTGQGDGGLGLGLISGFKLPRLAWGLLAAFGTYKAIDSKTIFGQVGFTGVSAFAWGKTFGKI